MLAPPTLGALWSGLWAFVSGARAGELEREVGALFPGAWVRGYCSGRAALKTALEIAMHLTGRRRVVLPAYTSYSVAAAAAAAGAEVVLGDVSPETLDYDRGALAGCVDGRTAAVVLGNLYGYPSRTTDIGWMRDAGALVVDDAAQALGATETGRAAGGRGDIGVLSFGRGKCITTGQGGALLIPDGELARAAAPVFGARAMRVAGAGTWVAAVAVAASRSQLAFGLLARLPGVDIGESHYDSAFETGAAARSADGLARGLADRVARQRDIRRRVAAAWQAALGGDRHFTTVAPPPGSAPAYLRFPLLAVDAGARREAAQRLARIGMTYVHSFPRPLSGIDAFRAVCADGPPAPGADRLAETVIALPCHGGVGPAEVRAAEAALAGGEGDPGAPRATAGATASRGWV